MWVEKRQNANYGTGGGDSSADVMYYWKEWIILAAVLLLFVSSLVLLRANGRTRIARQVPLLWCQKFLFPRHLRNGPPYTDPVPLNNVYDGYANRFGHRTRANIAPPPPSYDPYAQALPVYQAKVDTSIGTSQVPVHATSDLAYGTHANQFTYTIPEPVIR